MDGMLLCMCVATAAANCWMGSLSYILLAKSRSALRLLASLPDEFILYEFAF